MTKVQIDLLTEKFREKYGDIQTIALGLATTNRMLIKKGICTEKELHEEFVDQLKARMNKMRLREDLPKED